jgi:ribosomal protein L11 methyltransferase
MSHFRRLSIRVHEDAEAEPLRARLLELVPAGFEERESEDGLELAAYVPVEDVEALLEALPAAAVEPVPEGWEDAWRSFHHPVTAGGLWVGPPWEEAPDPARAVVIDPGRAFGTGAHPTTRLCVELLAATAVRGSLLDVGCGSGVLAIAAAKLGFGPVLGVDHDPLAIEATRVNARVNGVELDARRYDLLRDGPAPAAPVVLANLLGPLLRRLADVGFDGDEPPEALIASGLLVAEADDIAAAFARRELAERSRRTDGEWAALLFAAPRS